MTDKEIGEYMTKIGTLGFVWQFITLAGFHVNGYHISKFAKGFQENGVCWNMSRRYNARKENREMNY